MKLHEWCENNKFGKKILLADNVKNVNRLKRITNSGGCPVTNLEGLRMVDLARRIIIESNAQDGKLQKVEEADPDFCVLLMYKLLKDEEMEKYSFIPKECICMETAKELLRVVNILRSGKKKPAFHEKGSQNEEQIKTIITDYENALEVKGLYDKVKLLQKAAEIIVSGKVKPDEEIGVFSYMLPFLTYTEKSFLDALTKSPVIVEPSVTDKEDISIECCKVYGQFNEIQKVIEDICNKRHPFGKVNIMYSSPEYENIIRMALKERDIPFKFSSGYSIQDKPYISLILTLMDWIESDFDYTRFRPVIDNEVVQLGKDYFFGVKAGIGWGIDRYKLFADQMNDHREQYIDILLKRGRLKKQRKKENEEDSEVKICSDEFVRFVSVLTDLIQKYTSGKVNAGSLYKDIIHLLKEKVKEYNEDKPSLSLLESLKGYFDQVGEASDIHEAVSFIVDKIESLQLPDDEESDAVNIMQMGKVEILERPYQYCIGMSYEAFGSKAIDSPVFSDDRLVCLIDSDAGYVDHSLERSIVKERNFDATVGTMPAGELLLCGCIYDTRNLRKIALSNKFMEFCTKENTETYKYPNIVDKDRRYSVNKEIVFGKKTEDDKKLRNWNLVEEEIIDGYRHVMLKRLSPSKLSNIMECPWKYEYSIKYFENEPQERKVNVWLPANEKGNLFHQVFQEYCETIMRDTVISSSDKLNEKVLRTIYDNAIHDFELFVAKGSGQAFELERDTYYEQIRGYLEELYREMSSSGKAWRVIECEKEFETEIHYINEEGEFHEPVNSDVIELSYHGFIDRVDSYRDENGDEHYRGIDYKTGKKDNFEEKRKKHEQVQYVIYSMALQEEGKDVECFEYVFPCDGNDHIQCTDINELPKPCLERLVNIFLKKEPVDIGENACNYCDYKDICVHRMNLGEAM